MRRNGSLGWFLAIFSGILFTATNFFVKYFSIDAIEMLLVRSVLQTVLMALIIIISKRKFFPEKKLDKILVVLQVFLIIILQYKSCLTSGTFWRSQDTVPICLCLVHANRRCSDDSVYRTIVDIDIVKADTENQDWSVENWLWSFAYTWHDSLYSAPLPLSACKQWWKQHNNWFKLYQSHQ